VCRRFLVGAALLLEAMRPFHRFAESPPPRPEPVSREAGGQRGHGASEASGGPQRALDAGGRAWHPTASLEPYANDVADDEDGIDQAVISAQRNPASSRATAAATIDRTFLRAARCRKRPHNRSCAFQARATVSGEAFS
jgi:hypothetical protein